MAQLVERLFCKQRVAGSTPANGLTEVTRLDEDAVLKTVARKGWGFESLCFRILHSSSVAELPPVKRRVIGSNPICAANIPLSSSGRTSDFESENVRFESHRGRRFSKIWRRGQSGLRHRAFNPESGGSNPPDVTTIGPQETGTRYDTGASPGSSPGRPSSKAVSVV